MTRLLGLREWVNLPDAAAHLQRLLGEDVLEADLLRLAIDGVLQMSVRFVNQAMARLGQLPASELTFDDVGQLLLEGSHDDPQVIDGVWDLMPYASGEIELERRYQRLTNGPEVTTWAIGGIYLATPDRSTWAELVEHIVRGVTVHPSITVEGLRGARVPLVEVDQSYVSTHELQDDALLVVRTAALESFAASLLSEEEPTAAAAGEASRPIPKQAAQELAILSKLRELGIDPLAVPAASPGKPSAAKEAVREALGYSRAVVDHAWKRLRADGRLKNA